MRKFKSIERIMKENRFEITNRGWTYKYPELEKAIEKYVQQKVFDVSMEGEELRARVTSFVNDYELNGERNEYVESIKSLLKEIPISETVEQYVIKARIEELNAYALRHHVDFDRERIETLKKGLE